MLYEVITHLYPKVEITEAMAQDRPEIEPLVGERLTVIAWLWARTVKSPNPAFSHVGVPLVSTYVLSSKTGKEAYVHPIIEGDRYRFTVKTGTPPKEAAGGTKLARGANFKCLVSDVTIEPKYIYSEAQQGRMGTKLMAIVAEGQRGRVYLNPTIEMEQIALSAQPAWKPEVPMPENPRWFSPPAYGLTTYGDLFTKRQLVALTTFSDLVTEAIAKCRADALAAGRSTDPTPLDQSGTGATAYAEAVGVYLGQSVNKLSDRGSSICGWDISRESLRNTFGRQAIPMVWDFAEANCLSETAGSYLNAIDQMIRVITILPSTGKGASVQHDAQTQTISSGKVISTDPPYYDNIGYADLSDFFYVWLRKSLKPVFPALFSTIAVPKAEELVATPYRHGSKEKAECFFLNGMTAAMHSLAEQAHPEMPVTIYYAFKQSETESTSGTASTGWETFLEAVLKAGFTLTGTWPMRTELGNRMIGSGTNALAS